MTNPNISDSLLFLALSFCVWQSGARHGYAFAIEFFNDVRASLACQNIRCIAA